MTLMNGDCLELIGIELDEKYYKVACERLGA